MRIIFAGTPEFAAVALESIIEAGHEVVLVMTQPNRPSGRGLKVQESAVKAIAVAHSIQVIQPLSLKLNGKYPDDALAAHQLMKSTPHDIVVVAAYGLILPQSFLDLSRFINIHASLLPRWRGAAPIHRAIESGDRHTGITIMEMDAGLDTGDMLVSEALTIEAGDTTLTLHDKLAILGGTLVVQALEDINHLLEHKVPQPSDGMTYAEKLTKEEGNLNLTESAVVLERKIRAFNPFPGASIELDGVRVKIWSAEVLVSTNSNLSVGAVVTADKGNGIVIQCGEGSLKLNELQKVGSKRLGYRDFLNGHTLVGKVFK